MDCKLTIDSNGAFDVPLVDGDIDIENGMDTAIWVSLCTDARANADQVALPQHRRGWPGNTVAPVANRGLGGLLWLIDQRRLNQATLNEAVDYAQKALNWMLEDNVAQNIEVSGVIVPTSGIQLNITITALSGDTESRYINLWELTSAD